MATESVIGQSTVIRGNVRGDGSLEILGRVEGDVSVTGDVRLGDRASVRGNVSGARLTIGGAVAGDLTGSEAVVLGQNAQVAGDLLAPRIGIEEGALVQGAIRTETSPDVGRQSARVSSGRAGRADHSIEARAEPEPRRPEPRPVAQSAPRAAPPAAKKKPPAPVVPAVRRGRSKKKKARRR